MLPKVSVAAMVRAFCLALLAFPAAGAIAGEDPGRRFVDQVLDRYGDQGAALAMQYLESEIGAASAPAEKSAATLNLAAVLQYMADKELEAKNVGAWKTLSQKYIKTLDDAFAATPAESALRRDVADRRNAARKKMIMDMVTIGKIPPGNAAYLNQAREDAQAFIAPYKAAADTANETFKVAFPAAKTRLAPAIKAVDDFMAANQDKPVPPALLMAANKDLVDLVEKWATPQKDYIFNAFDLLDVYQEKTDRDKALDVLLEAVQKRALGTLEDDNVSAPDFFKVWFWHYKGMILVEKAKIAGEKWKAGAVDVGTGTTDDQERWPAIKKAEAAFGQVKMYAPPMTNQYVDGLQARSRYKWADSLMDQKEWSAAEREFSGLVDDYLPKGLAGNDDVFKIVTGAIIKLAECRQEQKLYTESALALQELLKPGLVTPWRAKARENLVNVIDLSWKTGSQPVDANRLDPRTLLEAGKGFYLMAEAMKPEEQAAKGFYGKGARIEQLAIQRIRSMPDNWRLRLTVEPEAWRMMVRCYSRIGADIGLTRGTDNRPTGLLYETSLAQEGLFANFTELPADIKRDRTYEREIADMDRTIREVANEYVEILRQRKEISRLEFDKKRYNDAMARLAPLLSGGGATSSREGIDAREEASETIRRMRALLAENNNEWDPRTLALYKKAMDTLDKAIGIFDRTLPDANGYAESQYYIGDCYSRQIEIMSIRFHKKENPEDWAKVRGICQKGAKVYDTLRDIVFKPGYTGQLTSRRADILDSLSEMLYTNEEWERTIAVCKDFMAMPAPEAGQASRIRWRMFRSLGEKTAAAQEPAAIGEAMKEVEKVAVEIEALYNAHTETLDRFKGVCIFCYNNFNGTADKAKTAGNKDLEVDLRKKAEVWLKKYLGLAGTDMNNYRKLEFMRQIADGQFERGDFLQAEESYGQVLKLFDPRNDGKNKDISAAEFDKGLALIAHRTHREQLKDEFVKQLKVWIFGDPQKEGQGKDWFAARDYIWIHAGDPDLRRVKADPLWALDDRMPPYREWLIKTLLEEMKTRCALFLIRERITVCQLDHAGALLKDKKFDEALKLLESAQAILEKRRDTFAGFNVEMSKNLALVNFDLGDCQAGRKENDRAREAFDRAIEYSRAITDRYNPGKTWWDARVRQYEGYVRKGEVLNRPVDMQIAIDMVFDDCQRLGWNGPGTAEEYIQKLKDRAKAAKLEVQFKELEALTMTKPAYLWQYNIIGKPKLGAAGQKEWFPRSVGKELPDLVKIEKSEEVMALAEAPRREKMADAEKKALARWCDELAAYYIASAELTPAKAAEVLKGLPHNWYTKVDMAEMAKIVTTRLERMSQTELNPEKAKQFKAMAEEFQKTIDAK
jgi:hypothetical protein